MDQTELCPTFIVAVVRKVLTLNNLLHNVICIDAGVIHTAGLPLHCVLLPPVFGQDKYTQNTCNTATLYKTVKAHKGSTSYSKSSY